MNVCFCRYAQVGNAVAVPVGVALGYAYGMASQRRTDDKPVIKLPFKYPQCMMELAIPQEEEQEMVNAEDELEMMLTWGSRGRRSSRRRRRSSRRRRRSCLL